MPYSGDPSASEIDAVRFWAQDTGATPLLSDAEYQYLIDFYTVDSPESVTSPLYVAALAADRIAAKYVGFVNISADGVNYSGDQLQQRWTALAKSLRESEKTLRIAGAGPYVGGITNDNPAPTATPPNFAIAMNDNPEAGTQNAGMLSSQYAPNEPADIYGSP